MGLNVPSPKHVDYDLCDFESVRSAASIVKEECLKLRSDRFEGGNLDVLCFNAVSINREHSPNSSLWLKINLSPPIIPSSSS